MSLRSPLGRVLGLGAAKEGVQHWWHQRVSAVALILLATWFVLSLLTLGELSYENVHAWMARPVNATFLVLLVITVLYHSQLGVQVVIEDYLARKGVKVASLIASQFIHIALGALAVIAVLRTVFGAAA
ncbi:MAG: succinate dehydrogenase, hydrophobic membrane anchor protein [Gammaproteobacteria bacterium]|nr:succinate dehydrogenase, hydrophobic membrane anchor protein [Gammaproteobacteria bacterium]